MLLGFDQQTSTKSKASFSLGLTSIFELSKNNEHLITNLAVVVSGRKEISQQHKALDVGCYFIQSFCNLKMTNSKIHTMFLRSCFSTLQSFAK